MKKDHFHTPRSILFLTIPLVLVVTVLMVVLLRQSPFSFIPTNQKFVVVCDVTEPCHITGLPYQNSKLTSDERVDDLLTRMTDTEKIGQMALIEKNSILDLDDIATYGLGALMSGAGGNPDDNTPEGWRAMIDQFQDQSQRTRLGIPLLYGVDANHGHGNVPGATIFPHAIGLGASHDADLVRDVAKATAEEVAATGVNWIFSPNLDVVHDIRWGRTYETFGSDPGSVGDLGQAFIEGIRSASSIAATAKHYIGNGSTDWGSSMNKDFLIDQGDTNVSEAVLRKTHLAPFRQAVTANVPSIMVGLNTWNGGKISGNLTLLTDVLKKELSFDGFVVSDWYGVFENEPDHYDALVTAINAGIDMVMLPYDYRFFSDSMHRALANGDIDHAQVDDAVRRILKVKFEIGLFDTAETKHPNVNVLGSQTHRELARRAVRKSLVLLKNNKAVPISKKTPKIFVSGSAADNIGMQSGGWTVEWQGIDGNWIPGTTILKGFQDMVSPTTIVEYDLRGHFAAQKGVANVGIAVVGEHPYAEGWGDVKDPQLSSEDLETINRLKKVSNKIIVIIVSGRPLNIKAYANDWDAIIAAWLPGTEGQGVADVLFGDHAFTGTLPVAWDIK